MTPRQMVLARCEGRCESCGQTLTSGGYSLHHRRPRQMGGDKSAEANAPSNLVALCGSGVTGCHGFYENNRALAVDRGWLVQRGFQKPAQVPVRLFDGRVVKLTDHGTYDVLWMLAS